MVHIIFPLTAFVFALALGLVVLLKNQRSTVNRNFLVFSLLVAAMFFSDVFIHAADSSATALMWSKVYWVFIALLPAVFVYFTTFFPKQRMSSKWWVNLFVFLPSLYFIIAVPLQKVYYTSGFNPLVNSKTFAVYFILYLIIGLRNFRVSLREPDTHIRRMQSAYAVIGILLFMFLTGLTEVILPSFGVYAYRLSAVYAIVMCLFISYSVHRHYLFVREPLAEECSAKEFQKFPLTPRRSILIKDRQFHEYFHIFLDQVLHGKSGLIVTRTNPSKILEEYPLKRTPILWITELNVKDAVNPTNVEEIAYAVDRFVGTAEDSVVYFDGFEYLMTHNTFLKTLHLLQDLKDKISMVKSNLLVPIKSEAFEPAQMRYIERELDRL